MHSMDGGARRCHSSPCAAEGDTQAQPGLATLQASSSPQVFSPSGIIKLKPGMWLRWAWGIKTSRLIQTGLSDFMSQGEQRL